MSYWLAEPADRLRFTTIERFDPRYWTVDFPRPCIASVVTTAADALQVQAVFASKADLAGLIWWSSDKLDHPLLGYATNRDYRGLLLSFQWTASGNLRPLDGINGATLTIEGRDASGTAKIWYVRLWNYATGTPASAQIALDFDHLNGGYNLPTDAVPVWAGDVDRMFISLAPSDYDGVQSGPISGGPVSATVTLSNLRCTGAGSLLNAGDARVPPHGYRTATGYDDLYNLTPERVVEGLHALGYRGTVDHYVGESHAGQLGWLANENRYVVSNAAPYINAATAAWHSSFFNELAKRDMGVGLSVSFELFDAYTPLAWKQLAFDGTPAQTGYTPSSTLLSPCNSSAMAYIRQLALGFCALAASAGARFTFQIGEPWWWSGLGANAKPCFYDAATVAFYPVATGRAVPPAITSTAQSLSADQRTYVVWLGTQLAAATAAIRDAIRTAYPGTEISLLIYTPQILGAGAAILLDVNIPVAWAAPAYDALQIEDYDFVTTNNSAAHNQALSQLRSRLGYADNKTDYFSGFVATANDKTQWQLIDAAAFAASWARNRYIWSISQINRDGFTLYATEAEVNGFHDVLFPLSLGARASGGPSFSTTVVETQSGYESRNINWQQARHQYDAAPGIRSESDLAALRNFFAARRGRAFAFRFTDYLDYSSALLGNNVTPFDQILGTGNGSVTAFPLIKHYGDGVRRITRPQAASLRIAINGAEVTSGWSLGDLGVVNFTAAPVSGATITAGFLFDVPVRFEQDQLNVTATSFHAGEMTSVPLIEIREA